MLAMTTSNSISLNPRDAYAARIMDRPCVESAVLATSQVGWKRAGRHPWIDVETNRDARSRVNQALIMLIRCQPGVIESLRQFVKVSCGRAPGATAGDADHRPIEPRGRGLPSPVEAGDEAAAGPKSHVDGA